MAISSIGWPDTQAYFALGSSGTTTWASNANTTATFFNVTWTISSSTTYGFYFPANQAQSYQITGNYVTGGASPVRVKTAAEIIAEETAEKASQQLVRDLVGEAGYRLWKQAGYIEIDSKVRPGTVYRIKRDAIDLFEKKDGKVIDLKQWLCVHPKYEPGGVYPAGDEVATRILLARFAEDDLWKTANLHQKRAA